MKRFQVRLGTRGSKLALIQAEQVKAKLLQQWPALRAPGLVEIVVIKTTGDQVQDRPLSEIGGKGLFAKELESALLAGDIDIAVHSAKDLPTWLPEGLMLGATLFREEVEDVLLSKGQVARLADLPPGAVLATSSLRRQAQALMQRPDLKVVPLRGNVDSRLQKLADGAFDAMILARAGLNRMGLQGRGATLLTSSFLPAVAQGAIGLEVRSADQRCARLIEPLNHKLTFKCVTAERACLDALAGSCTTPIGVLAEEEGARLRLRALLVLPDGSQPLRWSGSGDDPVALGSEAGRAIRAEATEAHLALLQP